MVFFIMFLLTSTKWFSTLFIGILAWFFLYIIQTILPHINLL